MLFVTYMSSPTAHTNSPFDRSERYAQTSLLFCLCAWSVVLLRAILQAYFILIVWGRDHLALCLHLEVCVLNSTHYSEGMQLFSNMENK